MYLKLLQSTLTNAFLFLSKVMIVITHTWNAETSIEAKYMLVCTNWQARLCSNYPAVYLPIFKKRESSKPN